MEQKNKRILHFFSALADETRLNILLSLVNGPKTVNQIHKIAGRSKLTLSAISHQLRQLQDVDIVCHERKGREKIFALSDDFCWCILNDAFKHFNSKTKCTSCAHVKDSMHMKKNKISKR
jgi:DNA-binding transcriptional ArsR family regulator